VQLEKMGCEIIFNDRVSSHKEPFVGGANKFKIELNSGKTLTSEASVYIPSFIGKGCTDYLSGLENVLDGDSQKVILDEHLRR
jgi:hypothetical protein